MDGLRKIPPLLALLLTLVVAGEVTDALPCADTACGVWNVLTHADVPPPEGGDHGPAAACPCQIAFASTAVPPAVPVADPEGGTLWSADLPGTSSPAESVPHPPPRG